MPLYRSGLAVLLNFAITAIPAFAAELVDLAPAETKAYVQFGNLAAAEQDVAAYARNIGTELPPVFNLDLLANASGLSGQWEMERGLAVAVFEATNQDVALLIPVKDAAAALRQLDAKPDGEFHSVTVSNMPLVAFAKGEFLIVGFDKETLQKFRASGAGIVKDWTKAQKSLLKDSDLFVHVNIPAWLPLIKQGLTVARQGIAQFKNLPAGALQNSDPQQIVEMGEWYLDRLESMLKQCRSLQIALDVRAESAQLKKLVVFTPDSPLHQAVSKANSNAAPLLAKVPSGSFFVAGAVDLDGLQESMVNLTKSVWNVPSFKKQLADVDPEQLEQSVEFYRQVKGATANIDFGDQGMVGTGVYLVEDPQKAREQLGQSMKFAETTTKAIAQAEIDTQLTQKKVGDWDVTELVIDYSRSPEHMRNSVAAMYGSDKIRTQFAVVDDGLGFALAGTGDPITKLAVPAKPITTQGEVAQVANLMPKQPLAAVFVNPLALLRIVKRTVEAAGQNLPNLGAAANKPTTPIGVAIDTDGGDVSAQLIVPAATVKSIIDAVNNQ